MPSVLNASTASGGGIIASGDSSGILQLQTGGTTAVTVDASQNVGIGTTSPVSFGAGYVVQTINATTGPSLQMSVNGTRTGYIFTTATEHQTGTLTAIPYTFYTNANERMRIDSSGNLLVGSTGATGGVARVEVAQAGAKHNLFLQNTTVNDTTATLLWGWSAGANSDKIYIYANGNVVNRNNSYGALSDAKLKENVVDATPKLADLLQVKIRSYNFIGDDKKQLGVIAQELETVFPSLVEETQDKTVTQTVDENGETQNSFQTLETTTKQVKYSVFVPMLIKAIQEQQALITTLTERITALEGEKA